MVLHLTESEVQHLLDMPTAIAAVEQSFRELAAGRAHNVPRQRAQGKGIVLHTMSAAADYLGLVGYKAYTTTRSAAQFHVGLLDQTTGRLVALIEADQLGRLRTGATTGVAVKHLAPPDLSELGLFGVGRQARTQLVAVCAVRPIQRAFVYSRKPAERQTFCDELSHELNIDVRPVDLPEQAVRNVPLIITATSSGTPVFAGNNASDGALICAVGSNWLNRAEIDETVVRRSTRIVCDSIAACQHEAGDFTAALASGAFDWSRAVELADVVTGKFAGQPNTSGLTLFKSVGMATEDLALGAILLDLARQQGVGTQLPI
ncbi:MAG: ornithine cyclodeaminase family protein [Planctomycetaceae bacterium]|nr:ornithine cyclodeaminase family protein [Planctomycetaceae bacterium]